MSSDCCGPGGHGDADPSSLPSEIERGDHKRRLAAVELPGGDFLMGGSDADANPLDGEGPVRELTLAPFAIDPGQVTNAEFEQFVQATGYRTEAEDFGWSFVFGAFVPAEIARRSRPVPAVPWWLAVEGAMWRTPEGPGSDISERADHPVVQVSWRDAEAFAAWAGGRLPSEPEWEYAARGGLVQARYVWGEELTPNGEHMCNIFQGTFPHRNTAADGYAGTCPVRAFPPNGYGYGMAGNVWDMVADLWSVRHDRGLEPGSDADDSKRVMRGGSYLCHDSYCNRYRVSARTSNTPDSASGNLGFRLAYDT